MLGLQGTGMEYALLNPKKAIRYVGTLRFKN